MPDIFSKETRSRIMSAIRGKDTDPELKLRKALSARKLRYRKDYRTGRKRIDIAFPGKKVAIFVDGCFWHGCPKHCKLPKSNRKYWIPKIKRNIERDKETNKELKAAGWKVLRFWEHDLKKNLDVCVKKLVHNLMSKRFH